MKLVFSTTAVLGVRLALATLALAQSEPPLEAAVPKRLELAATGGATVYLLDFGVLVSVPADRRTAVEAGVSYMPPHWEAPAHDLAYAQFRIAFREHLRSRKSLLVGATYIGTRDDTHGFMGSDTNALFPHAGVSLQWPIGRFADFRFDGVGLVTFSSEAPLVPRATAALVWHPGSSRGARR